MYQFCILNFSRHTSRLVPATKAAIAGGAGQNVGRAGQNVGGVGQNVGGPVGVKEKSGVVFPTSEVHPSPNINSCKIPSDGQLDTGS